MFLHAGASPTPGDWWRAAGALASLDAAPHTPAVLLPAVSVGVDLSSSSTPREDMNSRGRVPASPAAWTPDSTTTTTTTRGGSPQGGGVSGGVRGNSNSLGGGGGGGSSGTDDVGGVGSAAATSTEAASESESIDDVGRGGAEGASAAVPSLFTAAGPFGVRRVLLDALAATESHALADALRAATAAVHAHEAAAAAAAAAKGKAKTAKTKKTTTATRG